MGDRCSSALWMVLVFIHGCLGSSLNMKIDLDWGYIHFNFTRGAGANKVQCAKDFSLLEANVQRQHDILTAFSHLKYAPVDPERESCYSQATRAVYQPKTTNCATNFQIKENGDVREDVNRNKLQWALIKIANGQPDPNRPNQTSPQATDHFCLAYDFSTGQIGKIWCSGHKIPGVACQKNQDPNADKADRQNDYNMRQVIIIGASIGLSTLVLQVCILIGCAIYCCRKRECCGGERREARPMPSDAARCVRLQSLTSDGDSSAAYDHVPRDPLSRSLHSLNHLQQQKHEQDGHVYNKLGGSEPDTSSPYSQPYTHFVPTQPRNPPPKDPPPSRPPAGNEYAEPYPTAGRTAQGAVW